MIDIIVPVFNEGKNILPLINKLEKLSCKFIISICYDSENDITLKSMSGKLEFDDTAMVIGKAIHNQIINSYGYKYFEKRIFKSKVANAQEAHEAIRPTSISRTPESVKSLLKSNEVYSS